MAKWHTASLVTALKGILGKEPQFDQGSQSGRVSAFRAAADELTRRGLDGISLVRYGMWDAVASSVINVLTQSTVGDIERPGGRSRSDAEAWWAVLALGERPVFSDTPPLSEAHSLMANTIERGLARLVNWIVTAPVQDLVELIPPAEVIPEPPSEDFFDDDLLEQYKWAVDHFSSTFYSEWSTSSLHYAHRWLAGHEVPPCAADLMDDRRIDRVKLNDEIARRAATRSHRRSNKLSIDGLLAYEMTRYATTLLTAKRYREAAAIFEFALSQKAYDGSFTNNLGFCLIPESPLEALGHLRAAAEMNYYRLAVNVYNQMCCHIALRRPRDALAIAGARWQSIRSASPLDAILWNRQDLDRTWVIFRTEDDRASVAQLAMDLAHHEGWQENEATWREHREQLDR